MVGSPPNSFAFKYWPSTICSFHAYPVDGHDNATRQPRVGMGALSPAAF